MNLHVKATKTSVTPSLQADIEKKVSVFQDFLRPEDHIHVEVEAKASKDNDQEFRAEIAIKPAGLFAEASGSDVYEAVDLVIPKIRQQLTREKDKRVSLRRRLGAMRWKFWRK
jgi:ribosomal subunit interface protein